MKISEFKATHRTGKELARQLERLTAEADQMKRLASRMALKISATDARAKLDKLSKIAKPDIKTQKEIAKLTQFLEKNSAALVEIQKNPKLLKAWEKYQDLMKKVGGEAAAGETISATRFLRYKSVLLNAARFGGVAFVVMMVHGMEKADNKADFIGKTATGLVGFGLGAKAGFAGGAKLAQLGITAPAPLLVKALGGALGLVGGFVGAHYLESAYNYSARTVGDQFFVNRGQSKGWEIAASTAEVLGGAGINNFAELFDSFDVWNNIDLDEVIDENGNVNPLAYQEYLQASSVDLLAWERRLYRSSSSWDREMNQLIGKTDEKIEELQAEVQKLDPESEKFDEVQSEIEKLEHAVKQISENLLINKDGKLNKNWEMMQEQLLLGEEMRLLDQREQFVDKMPSHMRKPADELIAKMMDRISRNAGFIIDPESEEEDRLWLRLRDTAPITIKSINSQGEVEERDYTFPEWFLQFKEQAKRRYIYEQIRKNGKLPNVPLSGKSEKIEKPKKHEPPPKEGAIERTSGTV